MTTFLSSCFKHGTRNGDLADSLTFGGPFGDPKNGYHRGLSKNVLAKSYELSCFFPGMGGQEIMRFSRR